MDRFGQIEPKLFICCDAYWYNGKKQDVADKVRAVTAKLGVPSVIVPYAGDAEALAASLAGGKTMDAFMAPFAAKTVEFTGCPSPIRSISCFPPAPRACPNASCIRLAAR